MTGANFREEARRKVGAPTALATVIGALLYTFSNLCNPQNQSRTYFQDTLNPNASSSPNFELRIILQGPTKLFAS